MTELFDSLSEDEIEMIRLRYMKGLTLSEVASRYSISERTVRNHTNPIIKQVKEIISKAKVLNKELMLSLNLRVTIV